MKKTLNTLKEDALQKKLSTEKALIHPERDDPNCHIAEKGQTRYILFNTACLDVGYEDLSDKEIRGLLLSPPIKVTQVGKSGDPGLRTLSYRQGGKSFGQARGIGESLTYTLEQRKSAALVEIGRMLETAQRRLRNLERAKYLMETEG